MSVRTQIFGCALMLVAGACSGVARTPEHPVVLETAPRCLSGERKDQSTSMLFGVVTDGQGRPIPRAVIEAVAWRFADDRRNAYSTDPLGRGRSWEHMEGGGTTDEHGAYQLYLLPGYYRIRFFGPRGRLDPLRGPGGSIDPPGRAHRRACTVRYGLGLRRGLSSPWIDVSVPSCEWTCSEKWAPGEDWWVDRGPCPMGTHLRVLLEQRRESIFCESPDGQRRGPFTSFEASTGNLPLNAEGLWIVTRGSYDQGVRCGMWRTEGDKVSETIYRDGKPAENGSSVQTHRD